MKKKLTASVLCLALLLIMLLGSTLAWFTDESGTTNTMVVGHVKIEQFEKGIDGQPFQQNQHMYPAVIKTVDGKIPKDENGLWLDENINNEITKIVNVMNTGSEDAYIRTIFAFETGVIYKEGTEEIYGYIHDEYLGVNGTMDFLFTDAEKKVPMIITVNGVNYALAVCTYADAVKPGHETTSSMRQFFLSPNAGNEFQQLVGEQYDILVLTQAVQVSGFANAEEAFNTALPLNETTAAQWFTPLAPTPNP